MGVSNPEQLSEPPLRPISSTTQYSQSFQLDHRNSTCCGRCIEFDTYICKTIPHLMLSSATTSLVQPTKGDLATPRRIRHITGIQIRNLTLFPVRDAFTSALSQPAEQLQYGATGIVDDVGTLLSRRRARKVSTSSIATRRSLKWDDAILDHKDMGSYESRGRAGSTSAAAGNSVHFSTSPTGAQSLNSSRSGHSLRGYRARTSSIGSSSSHPFGSTSHPTDTSSTSITTRSLLPNNSQTALEKVINSRLVETFITIVIPPIESDLSPSDLPSAFAQPRTPPRSAPLQKTAVIPKSRPQKPVPLSLKTTKDSATSSPQRRPLAPPSSAPPSKTTFKTSGIAKQDTRSKGPPTSLSNGVTISTATTLPSHRKGKSEAALPSDISKLSGKEPESPVYFSPIHRPSTNPLFPIDARSGRDFLQWTDTSGEKLKVEAWGKLPTRLKESSTSSKKPRHHSEHSVDEHSDGWKLLDAWEFDLNKLIPLPADLDTNPSQLPSNTLLVTLSPPGQTFYLPTPSNSFSRPSSPSGGYASDPELPSRLNENHIEDQDLSGGVSQISAISPVSRRRRHPGVPNSANADDTVKTASWQKLFELVSLQSCILDNESSLGEVVQKIDTLVEDDGALLPRRNISEREARIADIRVNHSAVAEQCARKKGEIADRVRKLKQRRELLTSAREAVQVDPDIDDRIEVERAQEMLLRERITSARTSLISTLCTIYPIELFSPPDLLFTILDIPLPIPLNSNDPAPPLTMPDHKEVTEEAVATALGYVAQVLQILSAYTGKNLIYPVTCIGSRSLIRDGISAMVGPRMFPLYSKGVDTYRFEYGVFLLNKDIELLMSERDLRALDIRHTLPNLKNILLTLSHDDAPKHQTPRWIPSPVSSTSGLETPPRESSPVDDDIQTPKASHSIVSHVSAERITPTASGATTPTSSAVSDTDSRKAKSFLGFAPFTDFLRSRYPSSIHTPEKTLSKSSSNETEGGPDDVLDSDGGSEPDEEDRMTLHAVVLEVHVDSQAREGATIMTET